MPVELLELVDGVALAHLDLRLEARVAREAARDLAESRAIVLDGDDARLGARRTRHHDGAVTDVGADLDDRAWRRTRAP